MARRKTKPCEFCENEQLVEKEFGESGKLCVEFYPDSNLFYICASAVDDGGFADEELNITFDYCPMCGRKIGFAL